eukprot:scaffold36353_cov64-Phaeocystis_antarctica.AAC.4
MGHTKSQQQVNSCRSPPGGCPRLRLTCPPALAPAELLPTLWSCSSNVGADSLSTELSAESPTLAPTALECGSALSLTLRRGGARHRDRRDAADAVQPRELARTHPPVGRALPQRRGRVGARGDIKGDVGCVQAAHNVAAEALVAPERVVRGRGICLRSSGDARKRPVLTAVRRCLSMHLVVAELLVGAEHRRFSDGQLPRLKRRQRRTVGAVSLAHHFDRHAQHAGNPLGRASVSSSWA